MSSRPFTLDQLRRYALARSLFAPRSLTAAIEELGFLQADPIRAPARAQDLILRHRALSYRAGDLERLYPALPLEEGFFINYGFLLRPDYRAMLPRTPRRRWSPKAQRQAEAIAAFVRERESVHPREVDEHFAHGSVRNYWGGSSSATTQRLEAMHYRGWLRVVRRERGVRVYALEEPCEPPTTAERRARLDRFIDLTVRCYAPLPARSLSALVSRLRYAAPQWKRELPAALARARARLATVHVDGSDWFYPASEAPSRCAQEAPTVRLLAPFDPVVWDRRRFELLWGWAYRFEAYTPMARRKLGYYALPLAWGERVLGWANLSFDGATLDAQLGFVHTRPRDRAFTRELEAELTRMRDFLRGELAP